MYLTKNTGFFFLEKLKVKQCGKINWRKFKIYKYSHTENQHIVCLIRNIFFTKLKIPAYFLGIYNRSIYVCAPRYKAILEKNFWHFVFRMFCEQESCIYILYMQYEVRHYCWNEEYTENKPYFKEHSIFYFIFYIHVEKICDATCSDALNFIV